MFQFVPILAENGHNFVRAESLRPVSLEMVALICGLVLAWRHRGGGLAAIYAISLPFNDVVYRLGPLTLSDVIGLIILVVRRPRFDPTFRPLLPWIGWGLAVSLFAGASTYSIMYTIRFVIILVVASMIPANRTELERCVSALTSVTILAGAIATAQVVLWIGGLPIDGVFAAGGFIRPKALSHEPSTASVFFALSVPIAAHVRAVVSKPRYRLFLVAVVAGLVLTMSLSGIIVLAVYAVTLTAMRLRYLFSRPLRVAAAGVFASALVIGGLAVYGDQATELVQKVQRLGSEAINGPRPTSAADISGREGDFALIKDARPGIARGTGIFTAPKVAAAYEQRTGKFAPAANMIITTTIETGLIGLLLFLSAMFAIILDVFRRYRRDQPQIVAGFLGFCVVLLGQRFLAFPQPWFELGIARTSQRSAPDPLETVSQSSTDHAALIGTSADAAPDGGPNTP